MDRVARRCAVSIALLAASCAAPPEARRAVSPALAAEPPPVPVRHALPPGTLIAIETPEIAGDPESFDARIVAPLLREALRLGTRFDVAHGVEDGPATHALRTTVDARTGTLSVALVDRRDRTAPVPLAAESFATTGITAAIDRVAWTVRLALGEAVPAPPPGCAVIYSDVAACILATERAMRDEASGFRGNGREQLREALRADPGCTLAIAALAAFELAAGEAEESARLANTALRALEGRSAPTTRHRLARTLLLAQATRAGRPRSRDFDQKLLELGEVALRERPFDPHGRYTRALALNYLGRFEAAAEDLRRLAERWPGIGWVGYHLAFAELAIGDPEAARAAIEAAGRRLPHKATVLPRALALYHSGDHAELRQMLERFLAPAAGTPPAMQHEARRMLAALAILEGDRATAARWLLEDLEWLRARPAELDVRALELAEAGEVLVRLGFAEALAVRLDALAQLEPRSPTVRQALVYLGGLVTLATTGRVPDTELTTLSEGQATLWWLMLRAASHRHEGRAAEASRDLATAVRISQSALVHASFARSLEEIGRLEDAHRLREALGKRLMAIDLREPLDHPLLAPGRALAWLAAEWQ